MVWVRIAHLVSRERSRFVDEGGRSYEGFAGVPKEIWKLWR